MRPLYDGGQAGRCSSICRASEVPPLLAGTHLAQVRRTDSELSSQILQRLTSSTPLPDAQHIALSKSSVRMPFSSRLPFLPHHVSHVVLMRPGNQVKWIAAASVVATVKHLIRPVTLCQEECVPVSLDSSSV